MTTYEVPENKLGFFDNTYVTWLSLFPKKDELVYARSGFLNLISSVFEFPSKHNHPLYGAIRCLFAQISLVYLEDKIPPVTVSNEDIWTRYTRDFLLK